MEKRLVTIIGGARSGKSSLAVDLARRYGRRVLFAATAQALDAEMEERIRAHRLERPSGWETAEAPVQVAAAIETCGRESDTVIVDCITLLLSNLMSQAEIPESALTSAADREIDLLLGTYRTLNATFLIVTNEVGLGIVPAFPAGRVYRDVLGRVNRRLVEASDQALLLVAGIPVDLRKLRAEISW